MPLSAELYEHIIHHGEFRVRAEVEEDESWRQIIPYAVLEHGGCVFTTRRLKAGTEARLHGYLSIGIGGHINPEDQGEDVLEAALRRELREELTLGACDCKRPGEVPMGESPWDDAEAVGLIHTRGGVASVHTGILYRVRTSSEVTVRETAKLSGAFMSWAEVAARADGLEGWSRLALHALRPPES